MNEYTVIASVANDGELKVFHAMASNGFHAFAVVAKQEEENFDLEFLVAIKGKHQDGEFLTLPGEGIVCAQTILDQPDVFGPSEPVSDGVQTEISPTQGEQSYATGQKVVFEAYAASDYGDGPQFAVCDMTESFIEKLKLMMETCKQLKLSELRFYGGPDSWGPGDIESELRLNCAEVVVTSDSFWFVDTPKHADYHIETRGVCANEFFKTLEEAAEGETIFFGENEELQEIYEEDLDPAKDDTESDTASDSKETESTAISPDATGESQ